MRILLVEDNRDLAANLIDFLELHDCQIDYAVDGSKALVLSRSGQHDLIVLDVMMPGMDGFAVLEVLATEPRLNAVPVLVISAAGEQLLQKAKTMGAKAILTKPFDNQALLTVANTLVEEAHSR